MFNFFSAGRAGLSPEGGYSMKHQESSNNNFQVWAEKHFRGSLNRSLQGVLVCYFVYMLYSKQPLRYRAAHTIVNTCLKYWASNPIVIVVQSKEHEHRALYG